VNLDDLSPYIATCPYPSALTGVDRGILGNGFYPAARGFQQRSPVGGIMLLGRDWGTRIQYNGWCGEPPRDETASTWRNTRDIYLAGLLGVPVWCTNYLLGVRNDGSAVGNIRKQITDSEWEIFEPYCFDFLNHQVVLQRPKLIVVFGAFNRDDLQRAERLGVVNLDFSNKTFEDENDSHRAAITYAEHPHSLIAEASKVEARRKVARIREWYERELQEPLVRKQSDISGIQPT
jgi:hypothetical protein